MIETTKYSPLKIYVDATVREHDDGSATVAAVYRNHNDLTVGKLASEIGNGHTTAYAEFEAILRALSHVQHVPSIQHVKMYTDSQSHAEVIDAGYSSKQTMQKYVDTIARLSRDFEVFDVEWIERSENEPADTLADVVHELSVGQYSHFNGRWF